MEKEEKKKLDIDSPQVFWTRFILWVVFSLVIPILFVNYRYGLFSKISGIALSGWGTLVGIIVFVFCCVFLRYILHSKTYAFYKQIIKGCLYLVAPCCFVLWVLYCSRNTIDQLIQVLACCTLSWAVAICVNPMPRWVYMQSRGETENLIDLVLEKREKRDGK